MPADGDNVITTGNDIGIAVGNDIVALDAPEAMGRSAHHRFVERVFSPAEQALIHRSGRPDVTLWSLWAAKEAVFKIAVKLRPGMSFSPRRFLVEPGSDPSGRDGELGSGIVENDGIRCAVVWTYGPGWVHCIAADTDGPELPAGMIAAVLPLEQALGLDGAAGAADERYPFSGPESRGVRLLAGKLLAEAGLPGARILRTRLGAHRFSPPYVWWNGVRPARDVSLSHDGGRVAAVIGPAMMPTDPAGR